MDRELKKTLIRPDLNDKEKWRKYNQTLQRFLFFINQERPKNLFDSMLRSSLNRLPMVKFSINKGDIIPPTNRSVALRENNLTISPFQHGAHEHNYPILNEQPSTSQNISTLNERKDSENENETEEDYQSLPDYIKDGSFLADKDVDLISIDSSADVEQESKRPPKRNSDIGYSVDTKKDRKPEKPEYMIIPRPALNRWEFDQKNKVKTSKHAILLNKTPIKWKLTIYTTKYWPIKWKLRNYTKIYCQVVFQERDIFSGIGNSMNISCRTSVLKKWKMFYLHKSKGELD